MNAKKYSISLVVAIISISLITSTNALAGSKQQHRWEGVAIGVGAAILGHAIYQAARSDSHAPDVSYVDPPVQRRPYHRVPKRDHGRWELRKTWVPPVYERVWNPGHYNRHGHWVRGAWINVKKADGYWHRERVWVADNHHRPPKHHR